MTTINGMCKWIKNNWDNISDKDKVNIKPSKYSENLDNLRLEGHIVVLLLDRQKPSVESHYSFDIERIGINRFGEIIWGFDSGCSCPIPWDDSYPSCYNVAKTWKEFIVDKYDPDYLDVILNNFNELKNRVISSELIIKKEE